MESGKKALKTIIRERHRDNAVATPWRCHGNRDNAKLWALMTHLVGNHYSGLLDTRFWVVLGDVKKSWPRLSQRRHNGVTTVWQRCDNAGTTAEVENTNIENHKLTLVVNNPRVHGREGIKQTDNENDDDNNTANENKHEHELKQKLDCRKNMATIKSMNTKTICSAMSSALPRVVST